MTRKKIYLHLGMHKTGTTAVQVFCSQNETALANAGVLYPAAGRPRVVDVSYGHHLLPWSLTRHVTDPEFWPPDVADPLGIWDALVHEISEADCNCVLLSSEELDTLTAENVSDLMGRLSSFEVQPLVYLRRLDEFAQGMYTTDVVYNRGTDEFEAYRQRMRTPLDYGAIISPWSAAGANAPIVRYYTPELSRAGIVADVLGVLNVALPEAEAAPAQERLNVGCWPWYVVETCRQMNACNLPSSHVVKFAYIMRGVVGRTSVYDIVAPSEAIVEVERGLQSLAQLSESGTIPEIPPHFRDINPTMAESDWLRAHTEPHGAMLRVLQQLSRLVDKP